MTISQLQSVVLCTTLLIAIRLIFRHEANRNAYADILTDPVWSNFTRLFESLDNTTTTTTSNSTTLQNATIVAANVTVTLNDPLSDCKECSSTFYLASLPRQVFVYALLVPLQYYWQLCLERFFPARPRGVGFPMKLERKEKILDDDDSREEDVVKRWITHGRVRRSSLSWCNTFLKWILDITMGKVLFEVVFHLVYGFMKWEPFATTFGNLKRVCLLFSTVLNFQEVEAQQPAFSQLTKIPNAGCFLLLDWLCIIYWTSCFTHRIDRDISGASCSVQGRRRSRRGGIP